MNLVSIRRLLLSYFFIFAAISLDQLSDYVFFPLVVIILAHLYLTIILLGHEGAHGLLHKNPKVNTFIARFFCHFPFLVSHNHYRFLHLHHHRFANSSRDYDYPFYQRSYPSYFNFALVALINTLTFRYTYNFLSYFNGINLWIIKKNKFKYQNDYLQFILFWSILFTILTISNCWLYFFMYWFIPTWISLFWIYTLNLYQHVENKTHNITFSNKFLGEFLFPLSVNFHLTHHQYPALPYYQLETDELSKRDFQTFKKINSVIFKQQFKQQTDNKKA